MLLLLKRKQFRDFNLHASPKRSLPFYTRNVNGDTGIQR